MEIMRTRFHYHPEKTIAHRCDWVFERGKSHGDLSQSPQTIFCRNDHKDLTRFGEEFLPTIRDPFVLLTGDGDITLPQQVDVRYPPYKKGLIKKILNHPLLIHWYAENCDDLSNPKLSPLPLGVSKEQEDHRLLDLSKEKISFDNKKIKAVCVQRVRTGAQFVVRRKVQKLCETSWAEVVDDTKVRSPDFLPLMQGYSFGICATGGGIELAPKSWELLLVGTIPIMKTSTLDPIYQELPVVIVEDWDQDTITLNKLKKWREELRPFYEDKDLRQEVLHKLSMDYWWEKVTAKV